MVPDKSRPALLAVLASVMLLTTGVAGVAFAGTTTTVDAQTTEQTDEDPDGQEVIETFTDRLSTLETVEFTRITETETDGETMRTTERITADLDAFEKRVETLNTTLNSSYVANTTTVVNESTSVTYNADENTVTEYEYHGDILLPMVEQLGNESAVSYEYLGTDTIDGDDVYVLEATPEQQADSATTSFVVSVDAETYFPAQVTIDVTSSEYDFNYTSTLRFENVTLNEEIPDSTFDLDIPDDATDPLENAGPEILTYDSHDATQSAAELSVPDAELTDGYEFDEARIIDGDDYYTVSVTYTDGTDEITVSTQESSPFDYSENDRYEEISFGETSGWYASYDQISFLHWDSDTQSYSLYGELSKADATEVATAITEE